MANVQKYTRSACGHMFAHFERAKDENGEYIKFGNRNIDKTRTEYNYNLAPERDCSQIDYLHKRISEVRCLKRDDVKVMCSWCITAPQGVMYYEREQFFKAAYNFFTERYGGEQNVISSYVHCDESRDHMHYSFIPIVYDKKKEQYKVSAKDVLTKKELATIHADLSAYMQKEFGRDVGVLLDDTTKRDKNYVSMAELKRNTAIAELKAIESRVNDLKDIQGVDDRVSVKKPLWAKNERVEMSKSDYDVLYKQAQYSVVADMKCEQLQKKVDEYERERVEVLDLRREVGDIKRELNRCRVEIKDLNSEISRLSHIERFIRLVPDLWRKFELWIKEQGLEREFKERKKTLERQLTR